ncbi:phage major capsid protein [Belliella sp. DSM 107340]|uniref:Phage major capsid protein n=1 Tax=Belliella calami TaxID=2923436 RepID=A0ABS9UJ23_9BACT|nr:phage major capsid protein [Belliella calami]MCH7396567.1 phage major capsid protein [Belliella calami]
MKSTELKQLRNSKLNEMGKLIDAKDNEKRGFNEDEKVSFDALEKEIEKLDVDILQAEKEENIKIRMAGKVDTPTFKKEEKRTYSLVEHINQVRSGKPLDSFYSDVQNEGEKELRAKGVYQSNEYSVAIPASYVRDLSVTGASGAKGGELVQTDKSGFLYELMEGSLIQRLGLTVINGLENNIDMPKQKTSVDAVWADENDNVANIDFEVGSVPLRPKRLAAPYAISNKLLMQSSIAESVVRETLQRKIRKALDTKFVELLLSASGTIPVVMGVNGGALTYEKVLEMIQKVGEASEDIDLAKFLINYKTWGALKQTKIDAGSGKMVLSDKLADFDYVASNYVPSNLVKGDGTGLSALAFGDFSKVVLGNFSAMELIVDPYTLASQAKTKIVSNTFHDFAFTYPEAISIIKDAE